MPVDQHSFRMYNAFVRITLPLLILCLSAATAAAQTPAAKPNVVLIVTDDVERMLDGLFSCV